MIFMWRVWFSLITGRNERRTVVQISQESIRMYWACTRLSICLFACTTHSFACLHCSRQSPRTSTFPSTMVQISQKSRCKYWATHLSVRLYARRVHSFACLHRSRWSPRTSTLPSTMVQISQKSRHKYWATHLSVCLFTHTAHSFACSALLALLARSTVFICLLACSLCTLPSLWESV